MDYGIKFDKMSLLCDNDSAVKIANNPVQQLPAETYSASAVDRATEFCFLDDHDTKDLPKN